MPPWEGTLAHLVNTIGPIVCGGDVALCQITLTTKDKRITKTKPLKKPRSQKTNHAFTANNCVVDVVVNCSARKKISGRITDSVAELFQLLTYAISVRQVVTGTA